MKKIILASTSPRRKEIFEKTRLPFEIVACNYEEDMTLPLPPAELAKYLSRGKAESIAEEHPEAVIIAADTFVTFGDKRLGKPKSEERAREMLAMLSGQENDIITGVTIVDTASGTSDSFHDVTKVFMKPLSAEIIEAYIKTGEPLDKAGAYALQDRGALLIDRIEGDFFNAMGLPLAKLAEKLREFGVRVL